MTVPKWALSAFHQMTTLSSMPDHMAPPLLTLPGPQAHLVHEPVLTQRASFQCCSVFIARYWYILACGWWPGSHVLWDDSCFSIALECLGSSNLSLQRPPRQANLITSRRWVIRFLSILQLKEKISLIWGGTVLFVNPVYSSDNTEVCRKSCFRIHRSELTSYL